MPSVRTSIVLRSLVLTLAASCVQAFAADLPEGVSPGPSYAGISEYQLDNGLKVLLYPDPSKPRTLVNITYLVGSRHENYGETGMAHLLEHLVFKGTPEFRNLDVEFGKRGMEVNGTTSVDRTNYYAVFESNPEVLEWTLSMEASRMTKSFIDKSDLDSEMTVVRNEMEKGENDPFMVSYKNLQALAYQWHNYGNSTIGARSDVENVPIEKLQAFYRQWYQPDNAVLLVAGSFDPEAALTTIAARFGVLPKPERRLPVQYTLEPPQDGERSAVVRRLGGTPLLLTAYHFPGGGHPDAVATSLLAMILGDDATGRLRTRMVDAGLAAAAGGFSVDSRDSGQLVFYAQLQSDQDRSKARRELQATLESLAENPISEAELERARVKYRNRLKSALDDVSKLGLQLSEYIALGDWRLFFWEQQQLERVSLEDLNRVGAEHLRRSNRSSVWYLPTETIERVQIAAAPEPRTLVEQLQADQATSAGENIALDPASLEKRIERVELRPGLKLSMLPKQTRNDVVNFGIRLHFGNAQTLAGQIDAATALGELILRGTTELDRVAFDDALASSDTRLSADGGVSSLSLSGRGNRAQLARSLQLAVSALRTPRLDAAEFETWRKETLAGLEYGASDPQTRASEKLRELGNGYPAGHPLAFRSDAQRKAAIEALTLESVQQFHREFVSASTAEVVLVGDFAAEEARPLVEQLLADWTGKAEAAYTRIPDVPGTRTGENFTIDTPDKANAVLLAMQPMPLNDSHPQFAAVTIANHIFGGGQLEHRLVTRLRHKEGWSYNAASFLDVGAVEPVGSFLMYALTAPENATKVLAAAREELVRLVADGVTAAELEAARAGWLKARRVNWADDSRLTALLLAQSEYGRDLSVSVKLEQAVASLTVEQVNSAIREFIRPEALNTILAGDAAKVNAPAPKAD